MVRVSELFTPRFLESPHDPTSQNDFKGKRLTREEQIEKFERWNKEGFARINTALTETNLIPRLHGLFEARGMAEGIGYLVFDAMEISSGFPVPLQTRYILPAGREINQIYKGIQPGLAVFEIVNPMGARGIDIQIGLDGDDLHKVGTRGQVITKKAPDGKWAESRKKPDWWSYSYYALDMTEPYDVSGDMKLAIGKIAEGLHITGQAGIGELFNVYVLGKYNPHPKIVQVRYDTDRLSWKSSRRDWEHGAQRVEEGFKNIEEMFRV